METRSTITIRRATLDDIVAIKGQQRRTFDASPWARMTAFDDERVMQTILNVMKAGLIAVATDEGGRIVGSLGCGPHQLPWSSDWFLTNVWFSVDPEYRKGGTAAALVRKAQALAATFADPAPRLLIGVNTGGDDVDLKDRFVARLGFDYLGGQFLERRVGAS